MANQAVMFVPTNQTNLIQPRQLTPGTVIQSLGMVQNTGQQLENTTNQSRQVKALATFFKAETKTLGAIQIMIGLTHIGFGSVLLAFHKYVCLASLLFWTGLFFITSGSLSVSAEIQRNICLVKCSVGFNIVSAITALINICMSAMDLVIITYRFHDDRIYWTLGVGFSVLLLLFSLLEFCIATSTAHFGCQATCCNMDTSYMTFTVISGSGENCAQDTPGPPAYDSMVFSPKREAV